MIVSTANSIRFYLKNDLMMNMTNSRSDQVFPGMIGYCFAHKYHSADVIPIEVGTDATVVTAGDFVIGTTYTITTVGTTDYTLIGAADNNIGTVFTATGVGTGTGTAQVTVIVTVTYNYDTGGSVEISEYLNEVVGDVRYHYYNLQQSQSGYLKITDGTETWYSERIEIVKTIPPIKIEWFNFDDVFDFHYTEDIINFMRLDGVLKGYAPKGKSTVFDNQGESLKVKEVLYRQQQLILEPLPASIVEKLVGASAHDLFVVNDIEYVTEKLPTVKELGFSNLYEVEFTLTNRYAVGQNRYINGRTPITSGGAVFYPYWGSIQGNIYDQKDLQTEFDTHDVDGGSY